MAKFSPHEKIGDIQFDFLGLGVMTAFVDQRWGERIRAVFRESGNYCSAFLLIGPLMLAAVCESPLQEPAPVLQAVALLVPFSEVVYRCIELPIAELGRSIAGKLKATDFGVASPEREPLLDRELGGESIVAGRCNPVPDGKAVAQQLRLGRRVA